MNRATVYRSLVVLAVVIAVIVAAILLVPDASSEDSTEPLPTVYEYYTSGGVSEGLKPLKDEFRLNNKTIYLHSGSIHYFRVHPEYWRDRLRKLRAAGFVAVETYVPWNLHEPYKGVYDFGDGHEDMSPFLNLERFLQIAQEEDLLAILRPGPYICAEFEFGGLPSWLLREEGMHIRTSDKVFMKHVADYFNKLLPKLANLQFSTNEGPIIAFQVENEYGNTKEPNKPQDFKYLNEIKKMFEDAGLKELFFTSDTPSKGQQLGAIQGVLQVANFNTNATEELKMLKSFQPDKAAMVMEFWTGWFDHWGEAHHGMSLENFKKVLEDILKFPSGVNFYMFHGGTSFGFMNGGNVYKTFPFFLPDISSYDYDAPLSEAGDYTEKYNVTCEILEKYQKVNLKKPNRPEETKKVAYEPITSPEFIDWNTLISQIDEADVQKSEKDPIYMEKLSVNNENGQSYGYVVYRKEIDLRDNSTIQITGKIQGAAMVVVDNFLQSPPLQSISDFENFGYWCTNEAKNIVNLHVEKPSKNTVDIIVENWGRNNYGKLSTDFDQFRGLTSGQIRIDGTEITGFNIYALQFKGNWVKGLQGWKMLQKDYKGPRVLKFKFEISEPADTFLDMQEWGKGIVFVNGFNIGRYSAVGPLRSLFAPRPLFKPGSNEIVVFEHFTSPNTLKFSKTIIFLDADNTFDVEL